ncbi:hypothetical protein N7340_17475 [Comamonas aquatica]|uniref:hypothetical protein n=1 Tax=Comamonas aquatica TaxID=225991 RepID=UPI002449E677|nr:hypothetical protein [Comamonas aquatica]MDH0373541.1 hypothetical protein [Comamonas aquatica]
MVTALMEEDPKQWVYEASYQVYYNTKTPVPIKEIVASLQGLDVLLRCVPKALESFTGVEIEGTEFLVQTIEAGSLLEKFIVKFFFKDEKSFEDFAQKLGENKMVKGAAIAAVVAGVLGYGLHWATTAANQSTASITATNSVIIQNGAGVMNISEDAFKSMISDAIEDKKAVAESAIKAVAPNRTDKASTLQISGAEAPMSSGVEISAATIAGTPTKLVLEPNERIEKYPDTVLHIRATNLDSKTSGWAGKLAQREERLAIELDPSVSESELFGKESVRVSADLIFTESGKSRELKPKRIYVRKVLPPKLQ